MKSFLSLVLCLCAPFLGADCLAPSWQPLSTLQRAANHVLSADFNGDLKPDLAGNTPAGVFVALNEASQGLKTSVDVYSGAVAGAIHAADFNGDSKIDLAFTNGSSLVVLPGNGDGTFATPVSSSLGFTADDIDYGAFDLGPATDIVAYNRASAVLALFTNSGFGVFIERTRVNLRANAQSLISADIDGDGWSDVLVSYEDDNIEDVFYGKGDGSLAPSFIRGGSSTLALRAGDMDGDGLRDVAEVRYYGVAIIRNLGGRSFGDPLWYRLYGDYEGAFVTAGIVDLTGDGLPDVAAPDGACGLSTATSTGFGTLDHFLSYAPDYNCQYWNHTKKDLTYADFDGDSRTDLAISRISSYYSEPPSAVEVLRNVCGDSIVKLTPNSPMISAGQALTLTIELQLPAGQSMGLLGGGTVKVTRNGAVLGSATLSKMSATITVEGLAVGDHTLVAEYEGDAQYEPNRSAPVVVHVTTATTSTTISIDQPNGVYGRYPVITARVTASTGAAPAGPIAIDVNGVSRQWENGAAPMMTYTGPYEPGTYTYRARFLGSETHPPSSSATITFIVEKQTPKMTASPSWIEAGVPRTLNVEVYPSNAGDTPQGAVTVTEEGILLGQGRAISLRPLPAGHHTLLLEYPGDLHYKPVKTIVPLDVFGSSMEGMTVARGTAAAVTVVWNAPYSGAVARKRVNESWSTMPGGTYYPTADSDALPETVYLYRLESGDGKVSAADIGMRIAFTDEPLIPGMAIRAQHLKEVVRAANILRAAASLPALSSTLFTAGAPITAQQITALRRGINEARVAVGAYPFMFAGNVVSGAPIRAAHIEELREAIR